MQAVAIAVSLVEKLSIVLPNAEVPASQEALAAAGWRLGKPTPSVVDGLTTIYAKRRADANALASKDDIAKLLEAANAPR